MKGITMLKGSHNYFSFFGVLLHSVNISLAANSTKFEQLIETISRMMQAFLRERLITPLLIQQKIKNRTYLCKN